MTDVGESKKWAGLRPDDGTSVHRTVRGIREVEKWRNVDSTEKNYHAVGRTVYGLQPLVSQVQVDELTQKHRFVNRVKNMSISMQLDFLATEFLRRDRERYRERHGERMALEYAHFSPSQWRMRYSREKSFPDIEALVEAMSNPSFRVHNYHNRVTNLPHDKQGNLPYVWTRPTQRVSS